MMTRHFALAVVAHVLQSIATLARADAFPRRSQLVRRPFRQKAEPGRRTPCWITERPSPPRC